MVKFYFIHVTARAIATASLPFHLGGLELRESAFSALPSFSGLCNSVHELGSF